MYFRLSAIMKNVFVNIRIKDLTKRFVSMKVNSHDLSCMKPYGSKTLIELSDKTVGDFRAIFLIKKSIFKFLSRFLLLFSIPILSKILWECCEDSFVDDKIIGHFLLERYTGWTVKSLFFYKKVSIKRSKMKNSNLNVHKITLFFCVFKK